MYVLHVEVFVKPEHVDAFIDIIRANHLGSIAEPGCLRFDVVRSVDDPTRFVLWEAYVDEAASDAHKETPHYLAFKEGTADMMARERIRTVYEGLFPETGPRPG